MHRDTNKHRKGETEIMSCQWLREMHFVSDGRIAVARKLYPVTGQTYLYLLTLF